MAQARWFRKTFSGEGRAYGTTRDEAQAARLLEAGWQEVQMMHVDAEHGAGASTFVKDGQIAFRWKLDGSLTTLNIDELNEL